MPEKMMMGLCSIQVGTPLVSHWYVLWTALISAQRLVERLYTSISNQFIQRKSLIVINHTITLHTKSKEGYLREAFSRQFDKQSMEV